MSEIKRKLPRKEWAVPLVIYDPENFPSKDFLISTIDKALEQLREKAINSLLRATKERGIKISLILWKE